MPFSFQKLSISSQPEKAFNFSFLLFYLFNSVKVSSRNFSHHLSCQTYMYVGKRVWPWVFNRMQPSWKVCVSSPLPSFGSRHLFFWGDKGQENYYISPIVHLFYKSLFHTWLSSSLRYPAVPSGWWLVPLWDFWFWGTQLKMTLEGLVIKSRSSALLETHPLVCASSSPWLSSGLVARTEDEFGPTGTSCSVLHSHSAFKRYLCLCGRCCSPPQGENTFHFLLGLCPRKGWRIKHTVPTSSNKLWQTGQPAGSCNPQD